MAQTVKKSQYRQRVYQSTVDQSVTLVFGDDPAPADSNLLADHDIVDTATVTDHVES